MSSGTAVPPNLLLGRGVGWQESPCACLQWGSCCCPLAACAHPAYMIFTLQQETLHISEPYELLEGTKALSPPPAAAASLASPAARSYPKAQEVTGLTARTCSLVPSLAEPLSDPLRGLMLPSGSRASPQQCAVMAWLEHLSFSSPAAALINTQTLLSGALLSLLGIPAPTAALGFNPSMVPFSTGIPALPPCLPLTCWLGPS